MAEASGEPTVGSLFSGIGGIDLGLQRAGFRIAWQVEWDSWCQQRLADHWPDIPRYGDVTTVDWSSVAPVDVLAGGFPCQPVSTAGRRRAQDDARWLWPDFARAIRELRPRYVVLENVPNLLAVNDGRAFGDVLGDLAALGFDAEWDCLPAAFVGAHHVRDRVWVVAYVADSGGVRWDAQREGRIASLPPSDPAPAGPGRRILDVAGGGYRGGDDDLAGAWATQPGMGRVVDGLSAGLDWPARIHALGNAVVPEVVEWIGRRLMSDYRRIAA